MPPAVVTDTDVTAAFPRRPRPGIVMGLRGGQVALLATAGLLLLLVDVHRGVPATVPRPGPGSQRGARPAGGRHRPGPSRLPVARDPRLARGPRPPRQHRHVPARQGRHRARTAARARRRAAARTRGGITVHELDGVGYLYHPHTGTLTGIIEVTTPEFLLRDPADRNARVAGWGRVLAAATRTGAVRQVQLLERSIPDDGSALAAYTDTHLSTDPEQLASDRRLPRPHRAPARRRGPAPGVPGDHRRPRRRRIPREGRRRADHRPDRARGGRSTPCSPGCCRRRGWTWSGSCRRGGSPR